MQSFNEKHPNEVLKALSWRQPYLDLMGHGKIETRTWNTNYRGWVLMCGSQKEYLQSNIVDISGIGMIPKIVDLIDIDYPFPVNGKALFIGKLVDSRLMTAADSDQCFVEYKAPWTEQVQRKRFWTNEISGRIVHGFKTVTVDKKLWCHVYEDVQKIKPMPWKGSQGWRIVDGPIKDQIIII